MTYAHTILKMIKMGPLLSFLFIHHRLHPLAFYRSALNDKTNCLDILYASLVGGSVCLQITDKGCNTFTLRSRFKQGTILVGVRVNLLNLLRRVLFRNTTCLLALHIAVFHVCVESLQVNSIILVSNIPRPALLIISPSSDAVSPSSMPSKQRLQFLSDLKYGWRMKFLGWWTWRQLSSGMWCRVVLLKSIDASVERAASILSSPWKCHLLLVHVYCRLLYVTYAFICPDKCGYRLLWKCTGAGTKYIWNILFFFSSFLHPTVSSSLCPFPSSFAPVFSHVFLILCFTFLLSFIYPIAFFFLSLLSLILSQIRSLYFLPFFFSPSLFSSRISLSNQCQY